MKIISKFKDYYDYLTGIYGIDEKLILDRRENLQPYVASGDFVVLFIAGYRIEGLYYKKVFYYGEKLKRFESKRKHFLPSLHGKRDYSKSIYITVPDSVHNTSVWIYKEPVIDTNNHNELANCAILYYAGTMYYNPKLENLALGTFIPPEVIYKWITEWLSNQISKKETSPEVSNNLKIEAKGFNVKRSFRPKMK